MYSVIKLEELIRVSESTLLRYEQDLALNPNSLFAKGMVKNTNEQLEELRGNVQFQKQLREKEVVELRFRGKAAQAGRLPLEMLGAFAKQFAEALIDTGKHYQFGSRQKKGAMDIVRRSTEITFERLVPGSTRVLITGTTKPDLFGNSLFEHSMRSLMTLLTSSVAEQMLTNAGSVGKSGVKKLNGLLSSTIKSDLELDITWRTPEQAILQWEGNSSAMQKLSNTISKITEGVPQPISISGKLVAQSLKGKLEIESDDKATYKTTFPIALLEQVRINHIGDRCVFELLETKITNKVTNEEKSNYELVSIS